MLARGGLRILLLERHNVPGGYATRFFRGRFEFPGLDITLPAGRPAYVFTLCECFPAEEAGIRRFVNRAFDLHREPGYIHPCVSCPLEGLRIRLP